MDVTRNERAIATYATLSIHKVVRLAESAEALGGRLALPSETVRLLPRCFDVLGDRCQMCCGLGRALWAALVRLVRGGLALLLHVVPRCFRLHDDLGGRSHCGSQGR